MAKFGDFQLICKQVPSYPWCNLFYRQLQRASNETLSGLSVPSASAPVGINLECGIPRRGHHGSAGNVANCVACALSLLVIYGLVLKCSRRKEALGRIEFLTFLVLYYYTLPLKFITTGGFLEQGSPQLIAFTAIHTGMVVALFGALLANAIIATRVVEDGTLSTLAPFYVFLAVSLALGIYVPFDIAKGLTNTIGGLSSPPERLESVALFVITTIWPAVCASMYLAIMLYIVFHILEEMVPFWYFILAAVLFVLSQLAWFLLGMVICAGSHSKIDGSFVATILETAAVGMIYLAWTRITED